MACAMLAIPASANAAMVQVFDSNVNVADNAPEEQSADNIVFTRVDPWIVQLRNDAGDPSEPLLLVSESSTTVDCMQDNPRQLTCIRLGVAALAFDIYTNWGNDTVTIGAHNPGDTVQVRTHFGDDTINTVNDSADRVSCGGGTDSAQVDALDTIFIASPLQDNGCESTGGGSGGGGNGSGGGGGGSTTPPHPPAPIVNPPAVYPAGSASKRGGKLLVVARINGPGVVTGKAYKGTKLLGKGSVTATKASAVKLMLKPTKAAKRLLKSKRSIKVKVKLAFKPTVGATVTKTFSAKLKR